MYNTKIMFNYSTLHKINDYIRVIYTYRILLYNNIETNTIIILFANKYIRFCNDP